MREEIIRLIKIKFQKNPYVHAIWLEGADATGLIDEYSDMDIWFDVEDQKDELVFHEIEKCLQELGPFDFSYEQEKPHDLIRHKIYHIKNTPDTFLLDICLQSHSRKFEFTKELPGEEVKIIFDKSNVIKFKEFNNKEFNELIKIRIYHLKNTFAQIPRVTKMIKRKEFIDAFHYYYKFILLPLTELLRIRYAPTKQLFLKYISKDLPFNLARQLEDLYKINSFDDMLIKIKTAEKLFNETLDKLEMKKAD